jgi:hypothetical protein
MQIGPVTLIITATLTYIPMKKIYLFYGLIALLFFAFTYLIVTDNASGYIVAEWYGGNDPDLGDKITGDFGSFGMKDYYNQTKELDSRLWLDDYMLSKDDALEKIKDQCN